MVQAVLKDPALKAAVAVYTVLFDREVPRAASGVSEVCSYTFSSIN